MPEIIRLRPEKPTRVGEYDPVTDTFDVRLELGTGLGIYWTLPAGGNDRLRLFHVDGAAYDVDEPILLEDPFLGDVELEWAVLLAACRTARRCVVCRSRW